MSKVVLKSDAVLNERVVISLEVTVCTHTTVEVARRRRPLSLDQCHYCLAGRVGRIGNHWLGHHAWRRAESVWRPRERER